jgi:hypothetical protein
MAFLWLSDPDPGGLAHGLETGGGILTADPDKVAAKMSLRR